MNPMDARTVPAMIAAVTVIAALALLLSADMAAGDPEYTVEEVPFHSSLEGAPDTVELRFYEDMPNVPFTTLDAVYGMHTGVGLTVTDNGDGTYTYTNGQEGSCIVADPAEGTVTVRNRMLFSDMMGNLRSAGAYFDLFHKFVPGGTAAYTLSEHGIPVYADGGNAWMPLATASDILVGAHCTFAVYIGGEVFDIDPAALSNHNPTYMAYENAVKDCIKGEEMRPSDLAAFTYRELCFVIDCSFGNPGTSELGEELRGSGLDEALAAHSDASRKAAEWLQSEKKSEYFAGIIALNALLYDGGHTIWMLQLPWIEFLSPEKGAETEALLSTVDLPEIPNWYAQCQRFAEARAAAWGDGNYVEKGNTAVFSFDAFDVDYDAWDGYYAGGDVPDDAFGNLYKALEMARLNPEIRNFVIDVTTNGGGQTFIVLSILAIILGGSWQFTAVDVGTGEGIIEGGAVDTNLDGVFDERDLEPRYGFNFAVLTSSLSFSAANYFPILAQQSGVMVIGDRTGGGGNAIESTCMADFDYMYLSSYVSPVDYRGGPIEQGVTPDAFLVDTRDADADLSALYDIEEIGRLMDEHYSAKADETPYAAVSVSAAVLTIAVLALSLTWASGRRRV